MSKRKSYEINISYLSDYTIIAEYYKLMFTSTHVRKNKIVKFAIDIILNHLFDNYTLPVQTLFISNARVNIGNGLQLNITKSLTNAINKKVNSLIYLGLSNNVLQFANSIIGKVKNVSYSVDDELLHHLVKAENVIISVEIETPDGHIAPVEFNMSNVSYVFVIKNETTIESKPFQDYFIKCGETN